MSLDETKYYEAVTPPHLAETSWLDFEYSRALECCSSLAKELKSLTKKATTKRVHDSRVALRRFSCVWTVLKSDGWESGKFKRVSGARLKTLRKLLGELRDWDVTIELGKSFNLSPRLLKDWGKQRKLVRRSVKKHLNQLDAKDLIENLEKYLCRRVSKLEKRLDQSPALPSAYDHLNEYLLRQELLVQSLEERSHTAEELHQLRLAIKSWRYLLTEFFGLTNLELVRAQQYLGRLNDINRLQSRLIGYAGPGLARIDSERSCLQAEFNRIRKDLPYGLRPAILSPLAKV